MQSVSCEDLIGSNKLSQVLGQVGGKIIPMIPLLNLCCSHEAFSFRRESFTFRSGIGYLLSTERTYRLAFPITGGTLRVGQGR